MEPDDDISLFINQCRAHLTRMADELSRLDMSGSWDQAARKRAYNALIKARHLLTVLSIVLREGD